MEIPSSLTPSALEAPRLRDVFSLAKRIGRALVPYKGLVVALVLGVLVDVAFGAVSALSFAWLVDKAILPKDGTMLARIVLALGLFALVASAAGVAQDRVQATLGARVANDMRRALFAKMGDMSLAFFERTPAGELLARFGTDVSAVEHTVSGALPAVLRALLSFGSGLALLFALDARLAMTSLVVLPVCILPARLLARRATAATIDRRTAEAVAIGEVEEVLGAQQAIKAFGLEEKLGERFARTTARLLARNVRATFLGTLVPRSSAAGVNLLEIAVVALLGFFAFRGHITVGTILSFHALFLQVSLAVLAMTQIVPAFVNGAVSFRRLDEILLQAPDVVDEGDRLEAARLADGIDFRSVDFEYVPGSRVLESVTLRITAGSFVGIVGGSGSGKSTLAALLLRFRDATGGVVRWDGRDVRTLTQRSLRAQIGLVMQEPLLFETSIRENVRFGRHEASDAEVESACQKAEVDAFARAFAKGYDTRVGRRGGILSGGQRQRVSIARALVRDPSLLVLDEATSALDAGTEAAFLATLGKIRKGRTVVFITHRLASVAAADVVFVMDRGRLVEQGTHDALLAMKGVYATLWAQQESPRLSRPE